MPDTEIAAHNAFAKCIGVCENRVRLKRERERERAAKLSCLTESLESRVCVCVCVRCQLYAASRLPVTARVMSYVCVRVACSLVISGQRLKSHGGSGIKKKWDKILMVHKQVGLILNTQLTPLICWESWYHPYTGEPIKIMFWEQLMLG